MPQALRFDKKTARCQHFYTSASADQCRNPALPGGRICRVHLAAKNHPLRECLAVLETNRVSEPAG